MSIYSENKARKQPGAKNSWNTNKRWSKLQSEIYNLIDPEIDLQIQCRKDFKHNCHHGSSCSAQGNYWITLGRGDLQETLFHYRDGDCSQPYEDIPRISQTIREYIDTPKDQIINKKFEHDRWGFTELLKCADRRVGKRSKDTLAALILTGDTKNKEACIKILKKRFGEE